MDIIRSNITSFSSRQIAIEFYCKKCKFRGYKSVNEQDLEKYQKIAERFEKEKRNLLFPTEELPEKGSNVKNLRNYDFELIL